jgi:alginate O-acetyltransferase complex protein AlgI
MPRGDITCFQGRVLSMLFNSFQYILVFLPLSVLVYYLLIHFDERYAKCWLIFVSATFYSIGSFVYLPLLLLSIISNYAIISVVTEKCNRNKKRIFFYIGIFFNIGLLGYFKYADFYIMNTTSIFNLNISLTRITLPLAMSFYTFQQISLLIDIYRGEIKNVRFFDYTLYIMFFPRLLMGPITRYNELVPQFRSAKCNAIDYNNMSIGLYLFFIGLFERIVVADTFGIYADLGFGSPQSLTMLSAWATSISFTFQIFFDFSGYTDMAIGTAYFFNIRLPINFNCPYLSINIREFWRRWHITLSHCLRDYIYRPLGGNRKGEVRTCTNIMITFLIGGLWHGAGWTFIAWGGIHGIALCLQRIWAKSQIKLSNTLSLFITFNVVNIAWVFFRAKSIDDAVNVLKTMVGFNNILGLETFSSIGKIEHTIDLFVATFAVCVAFNLKNINSIILFSNPSKIMIFKTILVVLIGLLFLNSTIPREFIYNDF